MLTTAQREQIAQRLSAELDWTAVDEEQRLQIDNLVYGLAITDTGRDADLLLSYIDPESKRGEIAVRAAHICLDILAQR